MAAAKRGVNVRFIAAVLSGEGKINANARGVTTLQNGGVDAVCKTFLYIHAKIVPGRLWDAQCAGLYRLGKPLLRLPE